MTWRVRSVQDDVARVRGTDEAAARDFYFSPCILPPASLAILARADRQPRANASEKSAGIFGSIFTFHVAHLLH